MGANTECLSIGAHQIHMSRELPNADRKPSWCMLVTQYLGNRGRTISNLRSVQAIARYFQKPVAIGLKKMAQQ